MDDYIIAVNTGQIEPIEELDRFLLEHENLYTYDTNDFQDEPYGVVYLIKNKINNKAYIGITTRTFDKRYNGGLLKNANPYLANSIKKYGEDCFIVIKQFDIAYSKEHLDYLEDEYILLFNSIDRDYGYNIRRGGHRGKNAKETRDKIARPGKLNPFYGHHHTDEMKKFFSESQKRSKSKCAKKVICLETKQVFECLLDAADWLKLSGSGCLISHLKGKNKSVGKRTTGKEWHFMYYEDWLKLQNEHKQECE